MLFSLLFISCSPTQTYYHIDNASKLTFNESYNKSDIILLFDRHDLKYKEVDNYINIKYVDSFNHSESPTRTYKVSLMTTINYVILKDKIVVRVFDLKVKRMRGKTTKSDYDLAKFRVEMFIRYLNTKLEQQISF